MIKAVVFDYGGVIVRDILDEIVSRISEKFKLDLESTNSKIKSFFKEYQEKDFQDDESLKKLANSLDIEFEGLKIIWLDVVRAPNRIIEEVVDVIKLLKEKNYKIALLSNAIPYAFYDESVKSLFDTIVISSEIKIRKPDVEIYTITLERLGVEPEEAVFVDNREVNLIPAKELGMETILFQSHDQFLTELKKIVEL